MEIEFDRADKLNGLNGWMSGAMSKGATTVNPPMPERPRPGKQPMYGLAAISEKSTNVFFGITILSVLGIIIWDIWFNPDKSDSFNIIKRGKKYV